MILFIINIILLVIITLTISITLNLQKKRSKNKQKFEDIDVKVAYDFIYTHKSKFMAGLSDFIVLDVRSPKEFKRGYIKGAINLNVMDLNFVKALIKLEKQNKYIVCGTRESRSKRAIDIMKNRGFLEVYHMKGGMLEWNLMDFPIEYEKTRFNL